MGGRERGGPAGGDGALERQLACDQNRNVVLQFLLGIIKYDKFYYPLDACNRIPERSHKLTETAPIQVRRFLSR